MELLNVRMTSPIQDELEVVTDSTLQDAIKYGNIPESIYGIPGIPVDPFQGTYPCYTRIPVSTIALIDFKLRNQ